MLVSGSQQRPSSHVFPRAHEASPSTSRGVVEATALGGEVLGGAEIVESGDSVLVTPGCRPLVLGRNDGEGVVGVGSGEAVLEMPG